MTELAFYGMRRLAALGYLRRLIFDRFDYNDEAIWTYGDFYEKDAPSVDAFVYGGLWDVACAFQRTRADRFADVNALWRYTEP